MFERYWRLCDRGLTEGRAPSDALAESRRMRGRVRQIYRSWRKWHDATPLFFQSLASGPSLAVVSET